jgi:hypothetical protein
MNFGRENTLNAMWISGSDNLSKVVFDLLTTSS